MPAFYAEKLGRLLPEANGFYTKLGMGESFIDKVFVDAPTAFWDASPQGYNGTLGNRPLAEIAFGYEIDPLLSADIGFSYRPHFKYRKFQTSTAVNTPNFLGTKTREFDLDIATLMFTTYLSGQAFDDLNWVVDRCSSVYPIIGGGVGINRWNIYNFRSTGLPPVKPERDPSLGFASESQYYIAYSFSYQVVAGFEWRYKDIWALAAGYRWFGADEFRGPRFIRDQIGTAFDVGENTWKIKLSANEAFVYLKVFFK
jgi:opacity protein-like surface antigen